MFDFGWQMAEKGWGKGGEGVNRLQMHATDPDLLEKRLGIPQSKGCIRIPTTLNIFLDQHAILEGDYDAAGRDTEASRQTRGRPGIGRRTIGRRQLRRIGRFLGRIRQAGRRNRNRYSRDPIERYCACPVRGVGRLIHP